MEKTESQDLPTAINNSDFLYKTDVQWRTDIEYIEPNQFEKDMLKDSKTISQLIEEEAKEKLEQEEKILLMTDAEKLEEKKKNLLTIFKVIVANRLNYHPLINLSTLQPYQKETFMGNIKCLIEDYNNGFEEDISIEFNRICNDKLFKCGDDVSTYPVYYNV